MKNCNFKSSFLNIIALSLFFGNCQAQQPNEASVYKNPVLTVEQRIDDLLPRMTVEEKVGQMNMPCVYKQRIGWGLEPCPVSIHRQMTPEESFLLPCPVTPDSCLLIITTPKQKKEKTILT